MGCPKVTRASRPWGLLGAQAVGQGLVVEAHHIGTDHCGGDVGSGQLGHAVLVGVAVVLGPVTLDVELEALATAGITGPGEGDAGLPLVIPHQRHGSGAPAIGGATYVQAGEVLGIADADRGQAVLQGLVVEANPVLAADRGQYVGTPLFGHAILVGVAIVLGPVSG